MDLQEEIQSIFNWQVPLNVPSASCSLQNPYETCETKNLNPGIFETLGIIFFQIHTKLHICETEMSKSCEASDSDSEISGNPGRHFKLRYLAKRLFAKPYETLRNNQFRK